MIRLISCHKFLSSSKGITKTQPVSLFVIRMKTTFKEKEQAEEAEYIHKMEAKMIEKAKAKAKDSTSADTKESTKDSKNNSKKDSDKPKKQ